MEIKFRAIGLDTAIWRYGSFVEEDGYYQVDGVDDTNQPVVRWYICQSGVYYDVAPATVGQSTGVVNNEGVELYKGDIVRQVCGANSRLYWLYVINTVEGFGNNLFAIKFEDNLSSDDDGNYTYEVTRHPNGRGRAISKDMIEVGNIYEDNNLVAGTKWEWNETKLA